MKVCFIASPLTARSGVYRSGRELVAAGRCLGYDWSLLLGVSARAQGSPPASNMAWIREFEAEPNGLRGVRKLANQLDEEPFVQQSDVLVSLLPQTDMALARLDHRWVAYLRGLPWPERGEGGNLKRVLWKAVEKRALQSASEVWATTTMLRSQLGSGPRARITPAGIAPVPRSWNGVGDRDHVVWAARFDADKRPSLFVDALRDSALSGVMYGSGRLIEPISALLPDNVHVGGWIPAERLWDDASAYVGTSSREAFGRSAVEAAMSGIPVVLSSSFGCAELLITDRMFRERFILDTDDPSAWRAAIELLHADEELRAAYSDHLVKNAAALTIEGSAMSVCANLVNNKNDRGDIHADRTTI